jgi:hypothetical protein
MRISKLRLGLLGLFCALSFTAVGAGAAYAFQPHMVNARGDLHAAQDELNQAWPDKAGHRVTALNLVAQAINEVNLGIQAGAQ